MSPRPSTDGSDGISLGVPRATRVWVVTLRFAEKWNKANYYGREAAARERRVEPKSPVRGGTELRLTLTERES